MHRIQRVATAALFAAALAAPAAAKQQEQRQQNYSPVSQSDIQRLQDNVFEAGTDIQQLRSRDATRASQLQSQLDDLRDEVIYLKVKLRKDGTLGRTEYSTVRDRIEDLRSEAHGQAANYTSNNNSSTGTTYRPAAPTTGNTASSTSGARASTSSTASATTRGAIEVPAGTEIDVRLTNTLNSGIAKVEDRFEGTTLVDLNIEGKTVVPAGSVMRGVVTAVEPATRTNRTAKMTVSFDQVTINGRSYPIRGTVTQAIEGAGIKGETGRIATGAGVGAILGGILGGFKGALAGILIGGGGTIAATEGKEVELPQGSVLRVRLDSPVQIQPTSAGR